MQEVVLVANMATPARFPDDRVPRPPARRQHRPHPRDLADDATASCSFGLRGGKARIPSLETAHRARRHARRSRAMDWTTFSPNTADDETLRAIEADVAAYFAAPHDAGALRHRVRDQPHARPDQLAARDPRQRAARGARLLRAARRRRAVPAVVRHDPRPPTARSHRLGPPRPRRRSARDRCRATGRRPRRRRRRTSGRGRVGRHEDPRVRLGRGRARSRRATSSSTARRCCASSRRAGPTSCACYALGPNNPHGLEGAPMFDGLNVGKRNVTLNLKHPEGGRARAAGSSVEWADAVAENFAPRAMRASGSTTTSLARDKPDLVMISACLNGQTGPHRDYPGFGGQGSALAGYNFLTGWPDREPVGPHGTITDSLAPRFVATALAAGAAVPPAHRARRVPRRVAGRGRDLLALARGCSSTSSTGAPRTRRQRGDARAVPRVRRVRRRAASDGGDDRRPLGRGRGVDRRRGSRAARRSPAATRRACTADADCAARGGRDAPGRGHRGGAGPGLRRRARRPAARAPRPLRPAHPPVPRRRASTSATASGSRTRPAATTAPGPTLGQDQDWVLGELLGLDADEQAALAADGAFD